MSRRQSRAKQRRHRSRRAILARLGHLLSILGILCVLLGAAMGVFSLFSSGQVRHQQQNLFLAYCGASLGFFALRWGVTRARLLLDRPRRRRNKVAPGPVSMTDRSGSALVLTLVVLAVVAGLLLQVQAGARAARLRAESALRGDRLRHAAATVARDAMARLSEVAIPAETETNLFWNVSWDVDDPTGITSKVRITDENRYFDLNNLSVTSSVSALRAPSEVAMDLMTLCGHFTPVPQVEALGDWIDADSEGLWETEAYEDLQPSYTPANRILYGLSELLWVKGFSRDLFDIHPYAGPGEAFKADLVDCVTALPVVREQHIPVNINTASRPVLSAVLGLDQDEVVDAIVGMRMIRRITSMDKVLPLFDPASLQRSRAYLDVHSRYYRIDVRSFVDGQGLDLSALVYAGAEGRVEVLQWTL